VKLLLEKGRKLNKNDVVGEIFLTRGDEVLNEQVRNMYRVAQKSPDTARCFL